MREGIHSRHVCLAYLDDAPRDGELRSGRVDDLDRLRPDVAVTIREGGRVDRGEVGYADENDEVALARVRSGGHAAGAAAHGQRVVADFLNDVRGHLGEEDVGDALPGRDRVRVRVGGTRGDRQSDARGEGNTVRQLHVRGAAGGDHQGEVRGVGADRR